MDLRAKTINRMIQNVRKLPQEYEKSYVRWYRLSTSDKMSEVVQDTY